MSGALESIVNDLEQANTLEDFQRITENLRDYYKLDHFFSIGLILSVSALEQAPTVPSGSIGTSKRTTCVWTPLSLARYNDFIR